MKTLEIPNSSICPICSTSSQNPNDSAQQYCSNCKCFYGDIINFIDIYGEEGLVIALPLLPKDIGILWAMKQLRYRHDSKI